MLAQSLDTIRPDRLQHDQQTSKQRAAIAKRLGRLRYKLAHADAQQAERITVAMEAETKALQRLGRY